MRLAVLTNAYPPPLGGAAVVAQLQVAALRARGHEVRVFKVEPRFASQCAAARLLMHWRDLGTNQALVQEVTAWKPEVLLTHNVTGCGMGTAKAIQKSGLRWLHIIHDIQLIDPSGQMIVGERFPLFRAAWRKIWAGLRRFTFGTPNIVCSPSRWSLEQHLKYGFFKAAQSVVLPNPLPPWPITASDASREPSILFVGRVDEDKGVRLLVEAWKKLGDDRPRLDVAGEGCLVEELRRDATPGLKIHGPSTYEETRSYMQRALILVVPSLVMENQPMVILQGLLAGCRVVASDVGGIPETLGKAGWIVRAGDAAALSEALRAALDKAPNEAERQVILAKHNPARIVCELEAMLQPTASL